MPIRRTLLPLATLLLLPGCGGNDDAAKADAVALGEAATTPADGSGDRPVSGDTDLAPPDPSVPPPASTPTIADDPPPEIVLDAAPSGVRNPGGLPSGESVDAPVPADDRPPRGEPMR